MRATKTNSSPGVNLANFHRENSKTCQSHKKALNKEQAIYFVHSQGRFNIVKDATSLQMIYRFNVTQIKKSNRLLVKSDRLIPKSKCKNKEHKIAKRTPTETEVRRLALPVAKT